MKPEEARRSQKKRDEVSRLGCGVNVSFYSLFLFCPLQGNMETVTN